jgi:hypothetical protein
MRSQAHLAMARWPAKCRYDNSITPLLSWMKSTLRVCRLKFSSVSTSSDDYPTMTAPQRMPRAIDNYRPDIDGLRAVAVLSVVLYHAFPEVVRGGYVGVDIFFVILGFLITSILFTEIAEHRFSLTNFYGRRIRRIFPALAVCLTAVLAYGFVSLMRFELA